MIDRNPLPTGCHKRAKHPQLSVSVFSKPFKEFLRLNGKNRTHESGENNYPFACRYFADIHKCLFPSLEKLFPHKCMKIALFLKPANRSRTRRFDTSAPSADERKPALGGLVSIGRGSNHGVGAIAAARLRQSSARSEPCRQVAIPHGVRKAVKRLRSPSKRHCQQGFS